jgi:hypothetical protein
MGKKQVAVSLRKPPAANPSTSAEPAPAPAITVRVPDADLPTQAGAQREVTLLLPLDLARKLSVRCFELDRDMSAFVSEALTNALANGSSAQARDVVTVTISGGGWSAIRARLTELASRLPWTPFTRPQHAG